MKSLVGRQERLERPQYLILLSCLIAFAGCGDEQGDDISAVGSGHDAGMTASENSGGQIARGESNIDEMGGSEGVGLAGGAIDTFIGGRSAGDSPSVPEAEMGGTLGGSDSDLVGGEDLGGMVIALGGGEPDDEISDREPIRDEAAALFEDDLIASLSADPEGRFTRLIAALSAEGLIDLVASDRVTIFAPTNDAFEAYESESENAPPTVQLLLRHIVPQKIPSDELATIGNAVGTVPNMALRLLDIVSENERLVIQGTPIAQRDAFETRNGIVHIVDSVIAATAARVSPSLCSDAVTLPEFGYYQGSTVATGSAWFKFVGPQLNDDEETDIVCIDTRGSAFDTRLSLRSWSEGMEGGLCDAVSFADVDFPSALWDGQRTDLDALTEARIELVMTPLQEYLIEISATGLGDPGEFVLSVTQGPCRDYSVADVLVKLDQFGIYLTLVEAANLTDELHEHRGATVLAPSDDFFNLIFESGEATIADFLLEPELPEMVRFTVLGEPFSYERLFAMASQEHDLFTLDAGRPVQSSLTGTDVTISGANHALVIADQGRSNFASDNGFIHEVDVFLEIGAACTNDSQCDDGSFCDLRGGSGSCREVIDETQMSIWEHLAALPLSALDDLEDVGFEGILNDYSQSLTLLLPTESVLNGDEYGSLGLEEKRVFWQNHISDGIPIYNAGEPSIPVIDEIITLNGKTYPVGRVGGEVSRIGDIGVLESEFRLAANGVVHIVREPLFLGTVDACQTPENITLGAHVFGSTVGADNLYSGTCALGGAQGPERIYQYTHDSTQPLPICVKTFGSSFDTVAYVRRGSCAINGGGNEVACNDDCDHDFDGLESIDPDGLCAVDADPETAEPLKSAVTFTAEPGETYFVVIDGKCGLTSCASSDPETGATQYRIDEGDFRLSLTPGTCFADDLPTTILEVLESQPSRFGRLLELLNELPYQDDPALFEILTGGSGTGTLFAPTNAALEGVGSGTVSLSALKHHFIPRYSLPLEALGRYFNLESLAGAPISINVGYQLLDLYPQGTGETVSVNADLLDLRAQSGIVHGIDRLLPLPPECGVGSDGCPSGTDCRFFDDAGSGYCAWSQPGTCINPRRFSARGEVNGDTSMGRAVHSFAPSAQCLGDASGHEDIWFFDPEDSVFGPGHFRDCGEQPSSGCDVCLLTFPPVSGAETGTEFDSVIYVRGVSAEDPAQCADAMSQSACDNDSYARLPISSSAADTNAYVRFRVDDRMKYYIFVDSPDPLGGQYSLYFEEVSLGACFD